MNRLNNSFCLLLMIGTVSYHGAFAREIGSEFEFKVDQRERGKTDRASQKAEDEAQPVNDHKDCPCQGKPKLKGDLQSDTVSHE